jgi:hypothetical protein
METILSHWHCILPTIAIIIASIFMRSKPKDNDEAASHIEENLTKHHD